MKFSLKLLSAMVLFSVSMQAAHVSKRHKLGCLAKVKSVLVLGLVAFAKLTSGHCSNEYLVSDVSNQTTETYEAFLQDDSHKCPPLSGSEIVCSRDIKTDLVECTKTDYGCDWDYIPDPEYPGDTIGYITKKVSKPTKISPHHFDQFKDIKYFTKHLSPMGPEFATFQEWITSVSAARQISTIRDTYISQIGCEWTAKEIASTSERTMFSDNGKRMEAFAKRIIENDDLLAQEYEDNSKALIVREAPTLSKAVTVRPDTSDRECIRAPQ